jgi:TusE/DsrC/DsvC family sulfur relay protein
MNTQPSRDSEGYLIQPDDWDEQLAGQLANEEGIELNNTYWLVLKFMREYYHEHNITPDVRHVISHMATENQCGKRDAKKLVFDLFPYGYVKQACKIAGMKKPRAWSTG